MKYEEELWAEYCRNPIYTQYQNSIRQRTILSFLIFAFKSSTTHVWRIGRITNGMRSGRSIPQDFPFSFQTPAPTPTERPSQEELGSDLTASAPASRVSAHVCTNGVWRPLWPVSVAQKNKLSTMLSFNVQSIELLMDCMA